MGPTFFKCFLSVVSERSHLGGNAEVDLQPFGGRLVLGAPGDAVGLVDTSIADVAEFIPVAWVRRRSADLPVLDAASDQSQRPV